MSRARRSLVCGLLATVAAAGLIAMTFGADGPAATLPKAKTVPTVPIATTAKPLVTNAEQPTAVEQALDAPTELDFVDTPLKNIDDSIASRAKIAVLLDNKALADAGVTPDTTLTFKISGVSLRSALNLMLAQKDLAFVKAADNALSITTTDAAKAETFPRVYVVKDLIKPAGRGDEFEQQTDSPGNPLIEVITSTVVPVSWDTNGGYGSVAYLDGALVITQTEPIHRRIAKLLADLREVRQEQASSKGSSAAGKMQPAEPPERFRKALDAPLDLDFVDTPLKDVVDNLQAKLGFPIQLDIKTLADAGITPDTTITYAVNRIRARTILRRMLADHDMDFVIEDEALILTTADHAKTIVHPVVYAAADLCGFSDSASTGDNDSLIETITSIITPTSWDTAGAAGSIAAVPVANAIVCNQTDEIQRQIAGLLDQLRAKGCRYSPPEELAHDGTIVRIYKFQGTQSAPDEKGMQQLNGSIGKLIEPKSWLRGDASIEAGPNAIIVRQTPAIQKRVEQFLQIFGATIYPAPPGKGACVPVVGFAPHADKSKPPILDPTVFEKAARTPIPADKKNK